MKKILFTIQVAAFLLSFAAPSAFAVDDHNPIGVSGVFEGMITTGCAYNVLNHNARREIDDIIVPGSIGKYPLKMTRYYNSRRTPGYGVLGAGWTHEYSWSTGNDAVHYPNGEVWDSHCTGDWGLGGPLGVSDWPASWNGYPAFRLADGGTIVFENPNWGVATKIIDPYGQITTITLNNSGLTTRVTEPGGRSLQFNYSQVNGVTMLSGVDAYDGRGNRIDWVVYHYTSISPGGQYGPPVNCLTSVDYSDGQHAYYAYTADNVPDHPGPPCPCIIKVTPLLQTAQDVRYKGAMRHICYEYQGNGPHGAVIAERYSLNGSTNGARVSTISPAAPSPILQGVTFPTTYTETRGDSPTRTFNYTTLQLGRPSNEDACPSVSGPAPQQFLLSYTDFQNHTTQLGYDANWYVNSVRDARGYITSYLRGPPSNAYPGPRGVGQILRITHPDNSHIDYSYYDESPNISGHYLYAITDERGNVTTHPRDANHRITRTNYPDGGYETFAYNVFGQVLTHRLKNGAYERFAYDTRGLLTDKWNPKQNAIPADTDPHTHYTYYTSGPWTDRVMTMTLPANVSGNVASETYEYDRNASNVAVAGRGLVSKITHGDGNYQSFGYDAYGNKIWEQNELRQQTTYTYDAYNRVLTVKNPLNQTTTYTYTPTNGTGTSPYLHTTNNPDSATTPTGIITKNVYDQNFRKTSTTAAYGTAAAATTSFGYDAVGNPTTVTDPLNHTTTTTYDTRNRKRTVTNALNQTTTFNYDAASNVTSIVRPDNTTETKTYDAMDRMLTDTVPQGSTINLTTQFVYNPSGTIYKIIDPKGQPTWFTYNASDERIGMFYWDQIQTQSWVYDAAHNLASRTTVNGKTQYFAYDNRSRKYAETWSNSAEWRYFNYDHANRLIEATNGFGSWWTNIISDVTRAYDAAGRLYWERQNIISLGIRDVRREFNADGNQTRLYVMNTTYDYTFSYDPMGRFEKIFATGATNPYFQYYYDLASNETHRMNLYNGVDQIYTRDALNRMSRLDVKKNTTTLASEVYGYDAMSRLGTVARQGQLQDQFGYYLDGELWWANYYDTGRNVTYALDKAGNRTAVTDTLYGNTSYTPNNLNQYSAVTGSTITNGPEHEISAYQSVSYTYINDERLKQVTNCCNIYSLAYDALGRCVKRTLNNVTTYYVYDGERPILEYNAGGGLVGWNLYGKGIDEIIERGAYATNAAWYWYFLQQDHEGSVMHLTNASGAMIERYRYDVFGLPLIYSPNWIRRPISDYNNRFLFTGREYAANFGFYEYRARAYHPGLGRFMSEDPKLFDAGDYNLFRYCHNDPIDLTDPMGLDDTAPTYSPRQTSLERAESASASEGAWAMAKWADSSNNFQGTFAQFASGQSLTMGQIGSGMRVERAIPIRGQRDPMLDRRTENNLATLADPVQKMARSLLYHARADLGLDVRIIQGTRTYAEQNALYAQGRTTPGAIVTNAAGGYSFHNFGVAFDVGLFRGRAYVEGGSGYINVGHLGERVGLEWGGRWRSFQDIPHFQYPGLSLDVVRARFEQGLSPIPGY